MTVYNDLFVSVNNDTMTLEGICKARCGDKSHSCKCIITDGSGSGNNRRRMRSKRSLQAPEQPVSVTILLISQDEKVDNHFLWLSVTTVICFCGSMQESIHKNSQL